MPKLHEVRMRYPAGDPENGPAYPQRWNGGEWVCAEHKPVEDEEGWTFCSRCGGLLSISDKPIKED